MKYKPLGSPRKRSKWRQARSRALPFPPSSPLREAPAFCIFAESWRGTVQWIAPSRFRPECKRKNWFVAVDTFEPVTQPIFDLREVRWETMRASGPGGQHVNR
ncbi:MAG TPA: hypothetical protein VKZ53_03215, partial [Candidatus Angelobacter sp.]|nr:hypothetical protein [Candidatus Angelobacter sp.]